MKKIGIYNNKGGVGKTTTVINLAYCLSKAANGFKILVVDCDSQRNCSDFFSLVNRGQDFVSSAVHSTRYLNIDIAVWTADIKITDGYDIVLFDLPPILDEKVKTVLNDCDYAFVPLVLSKFAISGFSRMKEEIVSSNAKFGGAFICMYDSRSAGVNEMMNFATATIGEHLLHTVIPQSFAIANSINYDLTAVEYMNNSNTVKFYDLTEEILERIAGEQ